MVLPLEEVVIFEKGGRVLWRRRVSDKALKGDPINNLIGSVLLEEKGGQGLRASVDTYSVEWRMANEVDAILVLVYHKSMELKMGGELLEKMRSVLLKTTEPRVLDKSFEAIARDLEAKQHAVSPAAAADDSSLQDEATEEEEEEEQQAGEELTVEEKLRRRRQRTNRSSSRGQQQQSSSSKAGKKPTVWRDAPRKRVTAADVAELDYSKKSSENEESEAMSKTYMPEVGEAAAWDEEEEFLVDDGDEKKGWLGSLVDRASGNATLTRDDVEPIMEALRERLVSKNVAQEIASEICESVSTSLVGVKLERFGRVKTAVTSGLAAAVERVLTPKKSTDVLREVLANKRKPYVIVFVGINGVGKSTTLSKVAYYLKSHGLDVGIAACDTFRSGAVEQLRSHAKCLGVELFERGYLKDPAQVAKAAIDEAAKAKRDCVLVDTAGRMQNNEKLMRELAKLVSVNKPDLVLFVGEALVGNDGVSQITMFNKALMNFSQEDRSIDGIILTKFDCIDDKVGAALSVTYKTGQPIVFVGVGQKYIHLKKLSVNHILNSLFN